MRPDMDVKMRHQLNIKVGDKVMLTALSTTDDWHPSRHILLFQEFVVMGVPTRSTAMQGFDYRNWMAVELVPLNLSYQMNEINQNNSFYFRRIQMKKVKNKVTAIKKITSRAKMLANINAELNNEPAPLHPPEDAFDKKGWQELFRAGKHVQARKLTLESSWYKAGKGTFILNHAVEFRLKGK